MDSISSKIKLLSVGPREEPLSVGPREEPSVDSAEIRVAELRSGRDSDTMNRRCCRVVW